MINATYRCIEAHPRHRLEESKISKINQLRCHGNKNIYHIIRRFLKLKLTTSDTLAGHES